MADATLDQVQVAIKELREEVQKKSPNLEKIEKIEKVLEDQEAKNQALVKELKQKEAQEEELKDRVDSLELKLASNEVKRDYKKSEEYLALKSFCQGGAAEISIEQKALLRTDSDPDGGYLVPTEMDSSILKNITEISPIRSIARVRSIGSKSLEVPVRATLVGATYEGEAESAEDSNSTYQNETLSTWRQTTNIPITWDMLVDSAFDMESEILTDAAESFAQGEGLNFVSGDGVKKPKGFLADTRITSGARVSTNSLTLIADDVIQLTGDLKTGYNPVFLLSRTTLAFLRTLKTTDGAFLWQPGMNGPVANTLCGFPYLVTPDMGAYNVASAFPIAFGDFRRGYTIVDRIGTSIIRDEVTRKKTAIVEFLVKRWNTGQVVLPEAIKVLTVKP